MEAPHATSQNHFFAFAQTPGNKKSVHVVFVHGAWADGFSWSKVIALLQTKGINAVAVRLPLATLAGDVATVKRAIALQDGPVLLAGHSYGGAVITEAGESVGSVGKTYPPGSLGGKVGANTDTQIRRQGCVSEQDAL